MLKKRIIATLIVKDDIVVQSIEFKKYLPVGKPQVAIEFLNSWGIDEIIYLDISATKYKKEPNYKLIKEATKISQVPLTVGGGINNISQIKELMNCGADKISLNNASLRGTKLLENSAKIFGNQCVVISIDIEKKDNEYMIYNYLKRTHEYMNLEMYINEIQKQGAGEIFLNSVNKDGSYSGYDYDLINKVCNISSVPVICSGGAKNGLDIKNVFLNTKVSAASASNFFHFSEHSVITSKAEIIKNVDIRLDTHANYRDFSFDKNMRLKKKTDKYLEEMLFVKIEKEKI